MNTKERLERFLSDTPIKPVLRTKLHGIEVYVADGFVTPEMYRGLELKFAVPVEKNKFPNGCFATVWHSEGKPAGLSGVAYYEALHDVESVGLNDRQAARINKTLELAGKGLAKIKRAH
jgi:hypothetical protein